MLYSLDTNVLLRYLAGDEPGQSERARRLIDEGNEENRFLITTPVVCELGWVLKNRRLAYTRDQIADVFDQLLDSGRFTIANHELVRAATCKYREGPADFSDYLILELSQAGGADRVYSFDATFCEAPLVEQPED